MKMAFADPPYLGCAAKYKDRDDWRIWDDPETHGLLISRLSADFPDGWALSLHTPSLRTLLPMCPEDVRVCAWVKPFGSFKPNVNPAYVWEPVIVRGGRTKRSLDEDTVRDFLIEEPSAVAANITLRRGFTGAKPDRFCFWLFAFLGLQPTDTFVDLFPGSGAVGRAWEAYRGEAMRPVYGQSALAL